MTEIEQTIQCEREACNNEAEKVVAEARVDVLDGHDRQGGALRLCEEHIKGAQDRADRSELVELRTEPIYFEEEL